MSNDAPAAAPTTRRLPIPSAGAFCDHTAMVECHPPMRGGEVGCGHFVCPCGLQWDDVFGAKHEEDPEP